MSKPPSKPRGSEPVRRVTPTAPARKVSQPNASPKFYDGPTVPAKAQEAAGRAKIAASKTAEVARVNSRKAALTVRRHPWGFASLISSIPLLLVLSLFSTVLCPPPKEPQSTFSRLVTTHLGLSRGHQHSGLHDTFCYPANVYHREVLQPYVYPVIDNAQKRVTEHPIYKSSIQPGYSAFQRTSRRIWEGPVKPVVDRTVRGARRFYLTFIEPHLPYLRARYHRITAPYTARLSALHNMYFAPHMATAEAYAASARNSAAQMYRYVANHPFTHAAGDYAGAGYRVSRQKSYDAYVWSRPHAIRAGRGTERVAREVLGPRVVEGLSWSSVQAGKGWGIVKRFATDVYIAHLDPHVGPYVGKAVTAVAPYTSAFRQKVYQPYILPALEAFLPQAVFAPEPPKTFWSLIADFLPSMGSHPAETKGKMDDYYIKVDTAPKPSKVPIPDTSNLAQKQSEPPLPPPSDAKSEKAARATASSKVVKMEKEEMERVRDAIKERVEKQGEKGYQAVKEQIVTLNRDFLSDDFSKLSSSARLEISRDIEYVLKGLDKLFTSSNSLTREQVSKAAQMAEGRVSKTVQRVKEMVDRQKNTVYEQGKPVVASQWAALDQALGKEHEDLAAKMAWMDDVTQKDWDKYHELKNSASTWKDKYAALHDNKAADKQVRTANADVTKAFNSLATELNDVSEGFRERVAILKRTANDRIEARDAISSSAKEKVSILPVAEAAAAASGIIGKGKDQVVEALSQASAAVKGETSSGVLEQVVASASSAYDAASSNVHDVTRSVIRAVGATPSPELIEEHVESVVDSATKSVSSLYSVASDSVSSAASVGKESAASIVSEALEGLHQATRSIISAAGATPSPEGMMEHLESIANNAAQGAASVYGVIEENVHHATRSAISAAGVTPSPESPLESAQLFASEVSSTVSSLVSEASASIASLGSVASASASSVYGAASERMVEAASSAHDIPGGVYIQAQSAASVAGEKVHQGTRSAMKAVGVSPTPETPGEHVESIVSVVSASAASVASAASQAVHSGTRQAIKAVDGTPSPETPGETVESVVSAASASAASVFDSVSSVAGDPGAAVSAQGVLLASSIQSALGLAPEPTPLASSASAYLAYLASSGSSLGSDAIESGSSILSALQSNAASIAGDASASVHSATRQVYKAVGATPSPETPGEYMDDVKKRMESARRDAESLVRKHASRLAQEVGAGGTGKERAKGAKDEL